MNGELEDLGMAFRELEKLAKVYQTDIHKLTDMNMQSKASAAQGRQFFFFFFFFFNFLFLGKNIWVLFQILKTE